MITFRQPRDYLLGYRAPLWPTEKYTASWQANTFEPLAHSSYYEWERPGVESATCGSRVRRQTITPPRQPAHLVCATLIITRSLLSPLKYHGVSFQAMSHAPLPPTISWNEWPHPGRRRVTRADLNWVQFSSPSYAPNDPASRRVWPRKPE